MDTTTASNAAATYPNHTARYGKPLPRRSRTSPGRRAVHNTSIGTSGKTNRGPKMNPSCQYAKYSATTNPALASKYQSNRSTRRVRQGAPTNGASDGNDASKR